MHKTIEPKIMYFGTPVVLVSTLNEDGTPNLAPISSAWWLGNSCMIGVGTRSKTVENLRREKQCVLNLPSAEMVDAVDRLALTTGKNPVPDYKTKMNFIYEPFKFERAGLTKIESELVNSPRVLECPVHLEGLVKREHHFGSESSNLAGFEIEILRVHIEESLLNSDKRHHIDPDKWKPLIMSFCEFYGTGNKLHPSRLAEVF